MGINRDFFYTSYNQEFTLEWPNTIVCVLVAVLYSNCYHGGRVGTSMAMCDASVMQTHSMKPLKVENTSIIFASSQLTGEALAK